MNKLKTIFLAISFLGLLNSICAQRIRKIQLVIRTTGTFINHLGQEIPFYGFCKDKTSAPQLPGPTILAELGDTLEIEVTNISQQAQTVHFHGINVITSENGNPITSFSLAHRQKYTYRFIALQSGTYLYYGGVSNLPFSALGMYGLLRIVEQEKNMDKHFENIGDENTIISSELDTVWSQWMSEPFEEENPLNTLTKFRPNLFLLNASSSNKLSLQKRLLNDGLYSLQIINAGLCDNRYIFPKTFQAYISKTDAYAAPYFISKDTLWVSPGERYELFINYNSKQEFNIDLQYLSLNNLSVLHIKKINFKWSTNLNDSYQDQKKAIMVKHEPLIKVNSIRIESVYPEYQIKELKVYNLLGKLVSRTPIHFLEFNDEYIMNDDNFWNSYYYLKIQTNKNIYWKKINCQAQYNDE